MDSFISNQNAAGRAAAAAAAKKDDLAERLADAKSIIGDVPMLISAWHDPSKGPDCSVDFEQIMIYPESEHDSSFVMSSEVSGGLPQVMLPAEISNELDSQIKAILFPSVKGYDKDGKKQTTVPLVVVTTGVRDASTGFMVVKSVNGRKINPSDEVCLFPRIPKDARGILLTEIPEIPETVNPSNVFILGTDCPSMHHDAHRGDVFVYDEVFYKCYTFEEKLAAVKRQPEKLIPVPSLASTEHAMVFILDGFAIDRGSDSPLAEFMEDRNIENMYVLLMNDASYTVPATTGNDAKPAVTTVYEKGSFIFISDYGDKISKVPFDLFFQ